MLLLARSKISQLADRERVRILRQDILGEPDIQLFPLKDSEASQEIARFGAELWKAPKMEGYFDPRHTANLKQHVGEARHGFTTLSRGGILEVLSVPALPDDVMGFHIFTVYDPRDDLDHGRFIGYVVYSLEKGRAPFGRAEAVRLAFDIFPEFREGRYEKVPFTNHEIYNVSRRILCHYRPNCFLVDAKSQISQTRTGEPFKRIVYYLKRGYYPTDQKLLADLSLLRLVRGSHVRHRAILRLMKKSKEPFWVFPVRME